MPSLTEFTVSAAAWQADMACLKDVRRTVFILEQQVPESLEWDEFDAVSVHVLAHAQDRAIGTGRLLPDGHIGRMAVSKSLRGQGIGSLVLGTLLEEAWRQGHTRLVLHAQVTARAFYARHGFIAEGDDFMEAGMAHVRMVHQTA